MECKCGHNFCWLCLENWSTHGDETGGFYKCNKYEEAKGNNSDIVNLEKEMKNSKA